MITVCIDTLAIIGNQMLTESLRFGTGGNLTQKESLKKHKTHGFFNKLFFLKKSHKLFLRICLFSEIVLVFDVKSQYFYFAEDAIPISKSEIGRLVKFFTVDKNDLVYGLICVINANDKTSEVRTFHCINDRLVDAGMKLTVPKNSYCIKSICIV